MVSGLNHITIAVSDVQRSLFFTLKPLASLVMLHGIQAHTYQLAIFGCVYHATPQSHPKIILILLGLFQNQISKS